MKDFDIEILVSAVVWVPYTCLLAYLAREHLCRSKNLQSAILALLAIGAAFRLVWFIFYFSYVHYVVSEVINRMAMLFQFSGLSVLMYMWVRAISIAKLTDTAYNETSRSLVALSKEKLVPKGRVNRVRMYQEASDVVMQKVASGNSYGLYTRATIAVNIIVWCFVLGSLANSSDLWYNINIISISIACLVLAVGTLLVGVQVSLALLRVLSPVYVSTTGATAYSPAQTPTCVCMGRYGAGCEYLLGCCGLCSLYAFIFQHQQADSTRQGLQMQREVLKVILSVSTISSFLFLIRSIVFLYRPVVKEYADDQAYSNEIDGAWAYPFLYYQVPELVPNLVIALGISPPNGVLRHAYRLALFCYRLVAYHWQRWCACCWCLCFCCCSSQTSGEGPMYPQHGSFAEGEGPALSSTVSASRTELQGEEEGSAERAAEKGKSQPRFVGFGEEGDVEEGSQASAVVSPVHSAGLSVQRSGDIKISLASSAKPSDGPAAGTGLVSFQVANRDQGNDGGQGRSQGNTIFSVMAGSLARSASYGTGGGSGRYPGSEASRPNSGRSGGTPAGPSITLRRNSARGTWEAFTPDAQGQGQGQGQSTAPGSAWGEGSEAEEDAWTRQRRDSADIAEMVYRINSFSTTTASSLTLSYGQGQEGGHEGEEGEDRQDRARRLETESVDSNTILNSRRQPLRPSFLGGNRGTVPAEGGQKAGGKAKGLAGLFEWFS